MRTSETFPMAVEAIRTNKLRSFLTLVGIVAGVASIIAVMTGISVVQATMESELSVLGTQVFQVQKWPAGGFGPRAARPHRRLPYPAVGGPESRWLVDIAGILQDG